MKVVSVSCVAFTSAAQEDVERGLLGFISLLINGVLAIDGVSLRRTREGRLALSFPSRKDARGKLHPIVRPLDDATRVAIEQQVFAALGLAEAEQP